MRPESYKKLESPEIKDIIDRCTRLKKEERYTVKELLQNDFFAEDFGIKVRSQPRKKRVIGELWTRSLSDLRFRCCEQLIGEVEVLFNSSGCLD